MSQPTPLSNSADGEAAPVQLHEEDVLNVLAHGEIEERGLLPYSSNYSFLVTLSGCAEPSETDGETEGETEGEQPASKQAANAEPLVLPAVYKPRRGENPLWDFRTGTLCQREVAAYTLSHALGWGLVPPTVLRDGAHGVGSVQFYVENDEENHYFTVQDDARFSETTRRLALFDFVINNADRKSGHCLIGLDERLWAIDHGICFHTEYKLRTVIWEFSDEPIADELLDDLSRCHDEIRDERSDLRQQLCLLLADDECEALIRRTAALLRQRRYPSQHPHRRNFPWPPI